MAGSTKSVGKLIYDRRTELGITQKEVADFVGVSEATVSRWESGHIDNMRRDRIAALSKILRLSPLAIMGIDDTDLSTRLPNMISIDARTFRVPIVGRVAAGRPIVVDEEIIGYEYIDNNIPRMVTNTSVCVSSASLWSLPYIPVRFLVAAHGIR